MLSTLLLSKSNIRIGIEVIGGVLLIILLVTMFKGCNSRTDNTTYKDVISEMDKRIDIYKQQADELKKENEGLQKSIEQHERNDSLAKSKQTPLTIKYVQVPAHINDLSKDELRRTITDY